jgi:hypothetical protein
MTQALRIAAVVALVSSAAFAVTSKVNKHSSATDFLKGETENVVVSSHGALELGPATQVIADNLPDSWTVNAITTDAAGDLYIGTSPNGAIFKYSKSTLTKVYPVAQSSKAAGKPAEPNSSKTADANSSPEKLGKYLLNEHVFAMSNDSSGRVLAGISGNKCRLVRFDNDKPEVIFEPDNAGYIFAIALDGDGNIWLGTGPKGNVYRLDGNGKHAELIYHAADKNILSLAAGADGSIYAGSDERGLVYKIDPTAKTATVLYDAEQNEITSLLFDAQGNLYAAATSTTVSKGDRTPMENLPGKPESSAAAPKAEPPSKLAVANTPKKLSDEDQAKLKALLQRGSAATSASHVYKINSQGFVTDVFQDSTTFLCMASRDGDLLVGTGNKGQLFSIDPASEEREVIYQDKHSTQITALYTAPDGIYAGASNPARLIKLTKTPAGIGTYSSALVDAGQPAKWGKLQIEASRPAGTRIQVSARTGNVSDINDPSFSKWSSAVDVNEPVQLEVPLGRFCQYRLTLIGSAGASPVVREVDVPYMVPNLAPTVDAVGVVRSEEKPGMFAVNFKASDRNGDKLIYQIDIRKLGTKEWIKIKDKLEAETFSFDSRTVEDGEYEFKVTASDERSNTPQTKLTGSRVSDPVIIDNTPPVINNAKLVVKGSKATLTFTAVDKFSAIAAVSYTLDSNSEWVGTLPNDQVYDTLSEDFTISVPDLSAGQHILSVKVADAVGNTMYKSFEIEVK